LRFPALEELERGEIAERLMRTHRVVDVFPAKKLRIEMRDVPVVRDHLVELLVVRAMRPEHCMLRQSEVHLSVGWEVKTETPAQMRAAALPPPPTER
jgi:hypothetical protein